MWDLFQLVEIRIQYISLHIIHQLHFIVPLGVHLIVSLDVGNWDASLAISPPGQSGILGSDHYDDMTSLWRTGDYIPMPWSRNKVEELAKYTLVINP